MICRVLPSPRPLLFVVLLLLAVPLPAWAACGDGVLDEAEACDDGDVFAGDGCDAACEIETGHVCFGEPSQCPWQQQARLDIGGTHACVLEDDSEILCWGSATYDQTQASTGTDYVQVTAGNRHSCALRDDSTLTCWGSDGSGRATPPAGNFTVVEAGESHTCGLLEDQTISCWGSNLSGRSTPPAGTFAALGVGHANNCAIDTAGALTCWGSQLHGRSDPPQTGTFTSTSCGDRHCCGIRNGGTAECWGADGDGQLQVPPGELFSSIGAGFRHTCGLTTDARALCWGAGTYGQDEDPAGDFVALSVGWHTNCAFRTDGTLHCWGRAADNLTTAPAGVMLPEVCGDALLVGTEECDDGNTIPGDGCRGTCTIERCGDGILDEFEDCETGPDGFAGCCTEECTFLMAGSECRASGGVCDVAEFCTGAAEECPVDGKRQDTCRVAAGACDVEEVCDGIADDCPADAVDPPGTACRASGGSCDLAETCDGSNVTCPADTKRTDLCRASGGVCDAAEYCDGVTDVCPGDAKFGTETVCRGSAYECDAGEVCDGVLDACPADVVAAFGTACSDDGALCTEDVCDGSGSCIHFAGREGAICRDATHACDVAETCDGTNEACPADSGLPDSDEDGTCDAQDDCPEVYDPDQLDSDGDGEGDFCDICTDAGEAHKSLVKVTKITTPGGDDKLLVKAYLVFDEVPVYDPIAYGIRLRIDDAAGTRLLDSEIPAGAFNPVTRRGWLPLKNSGYRFRSKELVDGAVQKIILKRVNKDPNAVSIKIVGSKGDFASRTIVPPLSVTVSLDANTERMGVCAVMEFPGPRPEAECTLRGGGAVLVCR
jgi:cysteine-rich repeat protein